MLIKKISEEDIKNIQEIIDLGDFYYKRKNFEKFSEYDYKFHQMLAYSTHNKVIINIYNMIFPFLKYIITGTVHVPETLDETLKDHFEIVDSIKSKNLKKSREVISRHIAHVKNFLKKSLV
jgi:DNA-binding FadR family transcriptional regulator